MRWQTTDPLGFAESLNLYRYVRNNPFCYQDPDGRFALPFPAILTLFKVTFGTGASVALLPALGATVACALVGYSCYQLCVYASNQIDTTNETETVKEDEKKPSEVNGKKPVRTKPKNLEEQLALEEARANPGKEIPQKKLEIKDPNFPKEDWAKKQHIHEEINGSNINIHYWENRHTGERNGFKFKDSTN
jgi:hypothetical protein